MRAPEIGIRLVPFAVSCMASLTVQDAASLVQAATDAAPAAGDAVVALRDQQSNRGLTGGGFQEARKVVKQPDPNGYEAELSRWQDFNVRCPGVQVAVLRKRALRS